MTQQHPQIEFVLHGTLNGVKITPATIGLHQFNEFNQQVELFISGADRLKVDDVRVSVGESSYKLVAVLTLSLATALEPDLLALARQDSLGEIDPKRAEVVGKWQARSKGNPDLRYSIRPTDLRAAPIELSMATDFRVGDAAPWVKVEKYLVGTVMDMGGAKQANVHIRLDQTGEIVRVQSDRHYLKDQRQNHLYRKVLARVDAEQHVGTGKLRHLRLLSFEDYHPAYDEAALDRFATVGRTAWRDVPDAGEWVRKLRGRGLMAAGVVLDTSYLITLADPVRTHHQTARSYWRHFTEQAVPIFLPTIVVSEFCIRQEILPEILRNCVVLPFNWDDALKAASLDFSKVVREDGSRDALKDDVKIIAQAIVKDAAWVITDDTKSLYKFALHLKSQGKAAFRPIKLEDSFDLSFFDPMGQRSLAYEAEPEEPQTEA